jgi:hypothetical protein
MLLAQFVGIDTYANFWLSCDRIKAVPLSLYFMFSKTKILRQLNENSTRVTDYTSVICNTSVISLPSDRIVDNKTKLFSASSLEKVKF